MEVKTGFHFVKRRKLRQPLVLKAVASGVNGDDYYNDQNNGLGDENESGVVPLNNDSGQVVLDSGFEPNIPSDKCCHRHTNTHDLILIAIFGIWGATWGVPSMAYVYSKRRSNDKGRYSLNPISCIQEKDEPFCGSWCWCRTHAIIYLTSLITCLFMWEDICCCYHDPNVYNDNKHCIKETKLCGTDIDKSTDEYDSGSLVAIPLFGTISAIMICASTCLYIYYCKYLDYCQELEDLSRECCNCQKDIGMRPLKKKQYDHWINKHYTGTMRSYERLAQKFNGLNGMDMDINGFNNMDYQFY